MVLFSLCMHSSSCRSSCRVPLKGTPTSSSHSGTALCETYIAGQRNLNVNFAVYKVPSMCSCTLLANLPPNLTYKSVFFFFFFWCLVDTSIYFNCFGSHALSSHSWQFSNQDRCLYPVLYVLLVYFQGAVCLSTSNSTNLEVIGLPHTPLTN